MSRKAFAIVYRYLVTLGLFGAMFGYIVRDSGDSRLLTGMALLLGAVVGLGMVYQRDLRMSQGERQIEWQSVRSQGWARYVIVQVLMSQLIWLPLLLGSALELYRNRTWPSLTRPDWPWIVLAATSATFSFVYSVRWWRRQERRFPERPVTVRQAT